MSHRNVLMFFATVLGVTMSAGTVSRMVFRVSEAVAASVETTKFAARQHAVAHADETSWRRGRRKGWQWGMPTAVATFFEVAPDRGRESARKLAIEFKSILVVDRWSAYDELGVKAVQYCEEHLKRDWERFRLHGGVDTDLAERLARETDRLFDWRHCVKQGRRASAWLQGSVKRLRRSFRLLEEGTKTVHHHAGAHRRGA